MSFDFHELKSIPKDINEIKKLKSGVYKIKGLACLLVADNNSTRAIYSPVDCFDRYYDFPCRCSVDYIFESRLKLQTQDDLDRLLNIKLRENNTINKDSERISDFIYWSKTKIQKNNGLPKIGVELELETDNFREDVDVGKLLRFSDLVAETHNDISVYSGIEINFTYGQINTWKIKQIKALLDECKKQHLDNRYGTAGMHVHVSGKNAMKVNRKIKDNFELIHDIIMPISSRRRNREYKNDFKRYGVGDDCVRDQMSDFGTVEFRCFEATTNAKIFKRRLAFCRTLFLYLASDKPIEDFFKLIKPSEKKNYRALLMDKNNECCFGPKRSDVLLKLN